MSQSNPLHQQYIDQRTQPPFVSSQRRNIGPRLYPDGQDDPFHRKVETFDNRQNTTGGLSSTRQQLTLAFRGGQDLSNQKGSGFVTQGGMSQTNGSYSNTVSVLYELSARMAVISLKEDLFRPNESQILSILPTI